MMPPWQSRAILAILLSCSFDVLIAKQQRRSSFEILGQTQNECHNISTANNFVLEGHPLRIVSGSLHYFRVPAEYWRDRLLKLKAAGLNSVATYVEWSHHEPEERQYRFEGNYDVAAFVRMAAELGLYVLLRPGPYICAERDLGGLPYWLLSKYPNIKLRTTDKDFVSETDIWINKLFEQLEPLLFGKGGPIILVQIENEYGSYGSDMPYKLQQKNVISKHVGNNSILYTTDGASSSYFTHGAIPDTLTTIDFGPTDESVLKTFRPLRQFMPCGPLMNSEYYPGWLTHWGENMARTDTSAVVKTLKDMLDNNINVNIYVFYGGSNFEYTAGANYGGTYQPDITSYDYDAPLTEAGDPTPKYYAIRNALKEYNLVDSNVDAPLPTQKGNYGIVTVSPKLNLLSTEGRATLGKAYKDVHGSKLPTFEALRQRGGFVLYETVLSQGHGLLRIEQPRDLIFVFVDGILQGKISRMHKIYSVPLSSSNGSVLSLLVENQGRINYGSYLHDFKGILGMVMYHDIVLSDKWKITGYPLEDLNAIHSLNTTNSNSSWETSSDFQKIPAIYEGQFLLPDETTLDTFLDTTGWDKGLIWINGHNLGRYWPTVGPQVTLYVPGIWLKPAPQINTILVLELNKPSTNLTVKFIEHPILDRRGVGHSWINMV